MNWLSPFTDAIGLTDSGAGQRGLDTLQQQMQMAQGQLSKDMSGVNQMYQQAMTGRDMGSVIDKYTGLLGGMSNAGSADNVNKYMSPYFQQTMDAAANQALAGAGSSLQSSGANTAVATAVGNKAADMWQQAFQNALADAAGTRQNYQNLANLELMPSLNWSQLTSDLAGTKYTAGVDMANAAAKTAGTPDTIFSGLF